MVGRADSRALIPCFRAEKFVFCAQVGDDRHKILQIGFSKSDGSFRLSFPYYAHSDGLVSLVTHTRGSNVLELEPGGKITSHLVKYSHHPDGRAHFSQDGRVFTRVRKSAVPLDQLDWHLFTVMLQGLDSFATLDRAQWDRPHTFKRTTLNFDFGDTSPETVKVVGRLYKDETLIRTTSGPLGGLIRTEQTDGTTGWAFLASAPEGRPGDRRILVLTAQAEPALTEGAETALTFIGGFDPRATVEDPTQPPTTMLALSYPIANAGELRQRLGTIDVP